MRRAILPLLAGFVVALGLLVWWGGPSARAQREGSPPATAVSVGRVLTVKAEKVAQTLSLSGTVRPLRSATIATRLSGSITSLEVEEGDRVEQGQLLGTVDVSGIEAQTGQAAANVDLANATVQESDSFVSKAQAGVQGADARLGQLDAQRREALASLTQAEIDRKRAAYMHSEDAIAKADLDRANTALKVSRARVASVDASIRAAQADRQQAVAGVHAAQASVARTRAAVAVAQSQVGVASSDLSYGSLRAPFAGAVVKKMAQVGDIATPGRPLLQIDDVGHLHLDVETPEENLDALRLGQDVTARIDALHRDLKGHVYQIVPAADPQTRSFTVKVSLPSAGDILPGMYGKVKLTRGARETLLLPTSAIVTRGQLAQVFVVEKDSKARLRLVKTTPHTDKQVEVLAGLDAGERVLATPPADLKDGATVREEKTP